MTYIKVYNTILTYNLFSNINSICFYCSIYKFGDIGYGSFWLFWKKRL